MSVDESARNQDLQAKLKAQNDQLQRQLDEGAQATGTGDAHTDESVRRIEHPEEFAHERTPAGGAELGYIGDDPTDADAPHNVVDGGTSGDYANTDGGNFVNNGDGSYTRLSDGARGTFGPGGFAEADAPHA